MGSLCLLSLLTLISATGDRVLWIPGLVDNGVLARLDGQLSDLRWRLHRGSISDGPADAPATANAVVWFERVRHGVRLRLALPDGRRWRRDIDDLGPAATQEAAALVVRSALLAIEEGIAPDWTDEASAPPPTVVEAQAPRAPVAPRLRWRAQGWGWWIAGRTDANGITIVPGLEASVFHRWDSLSLGLAGSARWPYEATSSAADLRIERYDLSLRGAWDHRWAPAWAFGTVVGVGATVWRRTTERTESTLEPEPARWLASASSGLSVRTSARIARGWALRLWAGVDAVWAAPDWTLGDGTTIATPWTIQPAIGLGISADPMFDDDL